MVRRQIGINYTAKGAWLLIYNSSPRSREESFWLPLYGDGFLSLPILGSESGPCYLGNRDRREDYSCIREGWA